MTHIFCSQKKPRPTYNFPLCIYSHFSYQWFLPQKGWRRLFPIDNNITSNRQSSRSRQMSILNISRTTISYFFNRRYIEYWMLSLWPGENIRSDPLAFSYTSRSVSLQILATTLLKFNTKCLKYSNSLFKYTDFIVSRVELAFLIYITNSIQYYLKI